MDLPSLPPGAGQESGLNLHRGGQEEELGQSVHHTQHRADTDGKLVLTGCFGFIDNFGKSHLLKEELFHFHLKWYLETIKSI